MLYKINWYDIRKLLAFNFATNFVIKEVTNEWVKVYVKRFLFMNKLEKSSRLLLVLVSEMPITCTLPVALVGPTCAAQLWACRSRVSYFSPVRVENAKPGTKNRIVADGRTGIVRPYPWPRNTESSSEKSNFSDRLRSFHTQQLTAAKW